MMTRRHLLKVSAASVAGSAAGLVSQGIAQPIMKTISKIFFNEVLFCEQLLCILHCHF